VGEVAQNRKIVRGSESQAIVKRQTLAGVHLGGDIGERMGFLDHGNSGRRRG
jgi:hypothetical protein